MSKYRLNPLQLLIGVLLSLPVVANSGEPKDFNGESLPPNVLARLGATQFVHGTNVQCLVYSPDGRLLASGGDQICCIWDAQSGRRKYALQTGARPNNGLVFSPNSKLLVTASNVQFLGREYGKDLCLWDVTTGKMLFKLLEREASTLAIAFSHDGKTIVSGHSDNKLRVWDVLTGRLIRMVECDSPKATISAIVFRSTDNMLTSAWSDGKVRVWELKTWKMLTLELQPVGKTSIFAFSPDSSLLAAANAEGIWLYRVSTLQERKRIEAACTDILSVSFSVDSQTLITSGTDNVIRTWDVRSGKQLQHFAKANQNLSPFALSPNGQTVAAANGRMTGVIHCWDMLTAKALEPHPITSYAIREVTFLCDGETAATIDDDMRVILWPHGSDKVGFPLEIPSGSTSALFCPDGSTLAVATKEGNLLLVDLLSRKKLMQCLIARKMEILAVSTDNKRAVINVWPEGLQVWDLANKKILHRLATHAQVRGFSSDGRLLALDHGDWIQLWNVDTNEESWRFKQDSSTIGNFVFSKDGRMLVTQDSNSIFRLMETSTGKTRLQFKAPENQHFNIALSPGSKTLALGCWGFDRHGSADGTVELWDILNGQKLYVFHGHHGWINSVNFSSDGCRLLSGSYDTTALIYEIPAAFRDRSAAMTTLSKQDRSKYWENLADLDAGIAFAALKKLSADPESVSLCRQQLLVPLSPTAEQIQHWIVQLDDDEFAVREQASRDLEQAGLEAQNAAEQMLMTDCSPEVRRRIKELLDTFQRKQLRVHALRTVELLEQIGTGDAIDTLRRLEKKTKDPTLREDVERSLRRLGAIRR